MADAVYVVDRGLQMVTEGLVALTDCPNHVGYGVGTTAALPTNTALETPRDEARTEGTASSITTTTVGDTYQVQATIACTTSSAAITEVGIFDAATSGNMFLRGTFDAINLNVSDTITFTCKAVFNQA